MKNLGSAAEAIILRNQTKVLKTAKSLLRHLKPETRAELAEPLDTSIEEDCQILTAYTRLLGEPTMAIRMVAAINRTSLIVSNLCGQNRSRQVKIVLASDALFDVSSGRNASSDYVATLIGERCRVSIDAARDIWHVIAYQLTHGTIELPNVIRTRAANGDTELSL